MPPARRCRASTTRLPGPEGLGGAFEVGSGVPSPPRSPPLAAQTVAAEKLHERRSSGRREGAAYTITGECERLFCDVMRNVFLGERSTSSALLDMGVRLQQQNRQNQYMNDGYESSSFGSISDASGLDDDASKVRTWIELWDYRGGAAFRGFVAENPTEGDRSLCVFFDENSIGSNLKHGLMALLEFAEQPQIACDKVIVCVDRALEKAKLQSITRDLGWVGFELTTLDDWVPASSDDIISPKWLFLSMEV